ncbi:hypothetical protein AB0C59_28445 [Streptomyces sp. NPDC048664]|uniref:hypothetical protein n=1 Tax=Streptomyces sp. NPDC048664 TaxID=3154505 RepID=UPI0034277DD0
MPRDTDGRIEGAGRARAHGEIFNDEAIDPDLDGPDLVEPGRLGPRAHREPGSGRSSVWEEERDRREGYR